MSPTGGARNALMIGFLGNMDIDVSFMQWVSMGVMYTVAMSLVMAFLLPMLFKPEVDDLSEAVGFLKKDLQKHGAMTNQQKLVAGIMALVVVMWITDKSLVKDLLGFSLGLGGIAVSGAVLYMLFGLTSWKDYEEKVSWGVIVLYAGCISLGTVFKVTGASGWFADQIMTLVAPLGLNSGVGLVILMCVIGAVLTNLMSAGATWLLLVLSYLIWHRVQEQIRSLLVLDLPLLHPWHIGWSLVHQPAQLCMPAVNWNPKISYAWQH